MQPFARGLGDGIGTGPGGGLGDPLFQTHPVGGRDRALLVEQQAQDRYLLGEKEQAPGAVEYGRQRGIVVGHGGGADPPAQVGAQVGVRAVRAVEQGAERGPARHVGGIVGQQPSAERGQHVRRGRQVGQVAGRRRR